MSLDFLIDSPFKERLTDELEDYLDLTPSERFTLFKKSKTELKQLKKNHQFLDLGIYHLFEAAFKHQQGKKYSMGKMTKYFSEASHNGELDQGWQQLLENPEQLIEAIAQRDDIHNHQLWHEYKQGFNQNVGNYLSLPVAMAGMGLIALVATGVFIDKTHNNSKTDFELNRVNVSALVGRDLSADSYRDLYLKAAEIQTAIVEAPKILLDGFEAYKKNAEAEMQKMAEACNALLQECPNKLATTPSQETLAFGPQVDTIVDWTSSELSFLHDHAFQNAFFTAMGNSLLSYRLAKNADLTEEDFRGLNALDFAGFGNDVSTLAHNQAVLAELSIDMQEGDHSSWCNAYVLTKSGLVLTAYHCIEQDVVSYLNQDIKTVAFLLYHQGDANFVDKVVAVWPERDLAIVKTLAPTETAIEGTSFGSYIVEFERFSSSGFNLAPDNVGTLFATEGYFDSYAGPVVLSNGRLHWGLAGYHFAFEEGQSGSIVYDSQGSITGVVSTTSGLTGKASDIEKMVNGILSR
jgi:hypothetical protein